MRCLCHEAGKQLNVFEKEDRHSGAEVCRHLSKASWGPGVRVLPPLTVQEVLILERPIAPWGRQCPVRAKLLP